MGDAVFPVPIEKEYSTLVLDARGNVMNAYLTHDDKWRLYLEEEEISDDFKKIILYKEDKYFYYHPGFNPFSIIKALFNNIINGKRQSGASTITMQVARLLQPKKRTYAAKLVELFRALQLELHNSKDEILRMYLNLAPYGGNIEGIKSASVFYFNKMPNHLSLAQMVSLSVIPNKPTSLKIGPHNDKIEEAKNKWLNKMMQDKLFSKKKLEIALSEVVHPERQSIQVVAPHLCRRVLNEHGDKFIIKTFINPDIQSKLEDLAAQYVANTSAIGVFNSSVLVVDNKNARVVAYLGSPNFADNDHAGQVDGVMAYRQPGSTLKPFIYGLSFDMGFLTPKRMIADVPVNFKGYRPENFNHEFNGNVTVEKALALSLNIPAVKTLNDIGVDTFLQLLSKAECKKVIQRKDFLGLSVALGGCGISLQDLCGLYKSLSNNGYFQNLLFTETDEKHDSVSLLSEGACFMLTDVLTQPDRPDMPMGWGLDEKLPKIAWKTGTSYGRKDAWSIGYNQSFTIGVWVGNFDGEGAPELTGANVATPLLFRLFNALDYNPDEKWYKLPKSLDFRLVCQESGLPPNDFCDLTYMDYFLPTISTNQLCDHLRKYFVSADDSVTYCSYCLPESGYKQKYFTNYSPDLLSFYHLMHQSVELPPPHNSKCQKLFSEEALRILSPTDNLEYVLEKEVENQLQLKAESANDVSRFYWYVNKKFVGSCKASESLFVNPMAGLNIIQCADDKGHRAQISILVKYQEI